MSLNCTLDVFYVLTSNGDKGWGKDRNMTSPELAIIRESEQIKAAEVLGIPKSRITFLRIPDGTLESVDPMSLKRNITFAIRTYQPDLLLSFSPETDYKMYTLGLMHRDHQITGVIEIYVHR